MRRILQILQLYLIFLPAQLCAQISGDNYSASSVLASGEWFKIGVASDGIYRIDFSKLKQLGLKFPSNPKIFGNNFGQLSYYNDDPKPDDLKELSISVSGNDDILDEGEYILFFGKGPDKWKYNSKSKEYDFVQHNYSDTAYYFITSGPSPGKHVKVTPNSSMPADYYSSTSDALSVHEVESENLIKSGREWFEPISTLKGIDFNPGFANLVTSEKIKFSLRLAARASVSTIFRLYEGEVVRKSIQAEGVNLFNTTGTYAQISSDTGSFIPGSASPVYEIRFYNNGEQSAKGWVDWVKLQGRKYNTFTGQLMQYIDYKSVAPGRVTGFSIRGQVSDAIVWDVSDPVNAKQIQLTRAADSITFKVASDTLKTFVAFTLGNTKNPVIKSTAITNQNLHSSEPADMIIITHPLFREYAQKLANIHLNLSGLISQIFTPEQVYNEFSGGIPDIAAIRNFLRMKFLKQKGTNHSLKYLLLFGDGSYENKTLPPNNPNFIPTYQSQNSNVYVSSFTSDDFYGLLENGEGEADGTEDIGIGRLPVSDTSQAGTILTKIGRYLDPVNMGDWKNVICLTADDEDGNIHMSDAEGLASLIKDSVPSFNVQKIYLDAFRQTTSVNGQSYPEVEKTINDRINSGCLIFNFTGHGNENGLTSERVIKTEDINSWKNGGRLPLFITATCEFSRFDDIEANILTREMTGKTSAGEMVLLNKDGGGIALMSTTRVVYSAPNYFLNKNILDAAFDLDENGNPIRLGDIIRIAKNKSGSGANKRNFTLLGDPALILAYPQQGKIVTDLVSNAAAGDKIDSLKALSVVTVSGHINDNSGNLMSSFNGVVSPLVFDKSSKIMTLANDGGPKMEFELRNNVLYSGKTTAQNGRFNFTFIVPRDIDYSFGAGKISYYARDLTKDMNGSYYNIIVGGFSNAAVNDTSGPQIELYLNDTLFRNGGIADSNPRLLAIIEDPAGINTTGSGIGHDITAYIDNDQNRSIVLNDYFDNDFDNYRKGRITYWLSGLSEGSHNLTLKAWDNYNNSSEKTITFLVGEGNKFILKNLFNYPNPFLSETHITAEHNRPDSEVRVTINIYTMGGKIIKILKVTVLPTGYTLPPIVWDGNDNGGMKVGKGIYPYTVTVTGKNGETARVSGRMIILY
jgi:hypothetical protein